MGEVVSFNRFKEKESLAPVERDYRNKIVRMDKLELMEEMVSFQQERSRIGHLTPYLMVTGMILFKALTESAETHELRLLTGSYLRHLRYEYEEYKKA